MSKDNNTKYLITIAKAVASIAVCYLGVESMIITDGSTGVGWGILGIMFIWQ